MGYLTALLLALPLAAQEPQPAAAPASDSPVVSTETAVPSAIHTAAASPSVRTASGEPPAALAEAALCLSYLEKNWTGSGEGPALAISSAAAFITAGTQRALPPEAARELEQELALMREKAAAARALRDLARLRRALQDFFADKGGRWPAALDELVPDYLPAIPALDLPGHEPSSSVKYAEGGPLGDDPAAAVSDSGGWLYFSGQASDNLGLVLIDCSHPDEKGAPWSAR